MANFEACIDFVLEHEGGYVNHPQDPGGATNWGVSLRFLKSIVVYSDDDGYLLGDVDHDGDVDADDIRAMPRELAIEIYRMQWWDRYGYGKFNSNLVARKVLDLSVNMGPKQAHKILQRALNACGAELTVDGACGSLTFAAANKYPEETVLEGLRRQACKFYQDLVTAKPARKVFLKGWLRRANA